MSVAGNPIFNLAGRRVFVAGHRGMVGSALVRRLAHEECEILTASRAELDLERQADVEAWLADKRPSAIFLASRASQSSSGWPSSSVLRFRRSRSTRSIEPSFAAGLPMLVQ